jgi:DNA-binding winged helix-turn-helix (wHTH) protein
MSLRRSEVTIDRRKVGELQASEEQVQAVGLPTLAFGPFVAEAETGRLLESGHVVALAPKPFETLYYLASHPGRVVPKTELMERLWPGTFVTDDVLVQCVVDIRRALHDPAKSPQYVQTVPRRGYQFLATVREAQAPDPAAVGDAPPAPPLPFTAAPGAAKKLPRWWIWAAAGGSSCWPRSASTSGSGPRARRCFRRRRPRSSWARCSSCR